MNVTSIELWLTTKIVCLLPDTFYVFKDTERREFFEWIYQRPAATWIRWSRGVLNDNALVIDFAFSFINYNGGYKGKNEATTFPIKAVCFM